MNSLLKIILLFIIILQSCNDDSKDSIEKINSSYKINHNIKAVNEIDLFFYIYNNFSYIPESGEYDYWQLPHETISLDGGDCEDLAILYMYLLKDILQIESSLILISFNKSAHAIVKINNHYYDTTFGYHNNSIPNEWKIIKEISYNDLFNYEINSHH